MRSERWIARASALLVMYTPAVAWAEGEGGGLSVSTFQNILVLLAVVGVAYLITHALLERVQRRFGVVTGVEYILFGVLAGPVLEFLDPSTIGQFTPAIVLGTGSLGLLTGLHVSFRRFGALELEATRVAMWTTLTTLLVMVGLPLLLLWAFAPASQLAFWTPAVVCAGAVALVADTSPMHALRQFLQARGEAISLAVSTAQLSSSLAIIAFGVLFCLYNPGQVVLPPGVRAQSFYAVLAAYPAVEWLLVHLLIGALLGLIFGTFLRRELEDEKLLTVAMGMVIFTSGIAYYLRLSPIFVNFVLGVVLINTCYQGKRVETMLVSIERPLYIVLFFFAGATFSLQAPWWSLGLVIPYLVLRSTGRALGGLLAMRTSAIEPKQPSMARALLAPGGLSVAMILDFHAVYLGAQFEQVVYAALLCSVVVSELLAHRRTKSWLIDFTDVPPAQLRGGRAPQRAEGV